VVLKGRQPDNQNTCLGGDDHPDFISYLKTATSLKFFLSDEYLNEFSQPTPLFRVQIGIMANGPCNHLLPFTWKRSLEDRFTAPFFQPFKHRRSLKELFQTGKSDKAAVVIFCQPAHQGGETGQVEFCTRLPEENREANSMDADPSRTI